MSHQLVRPTEFLRTTLVQEAHVILHPCLDTRVAVREVQLLVPPGPAVFAGLDETPEDVGPNRVYKLCRMPPGQSIVFKLLGAQYLVAAAEEQLVEATLIVEYRA